MASQQHRNPKGPRLIDAAVRYGQGGFEHCDVRDLNLHGVLVLGRDGTLTKLPRDAKVDVALKLNTDGQTKTHLLRARVDRKTRDGTGLVFTDADIDAFSALLYLDT